MVRGFELQPWDNIFLMSQEKARLANTVEIRDARNISNRRSYCAQPLLALQQLLAPILGAIPFRAMSVGDERSNRRLARQGRQDVRLSLSFEDYFQPKLNTGGGRSTTDVNVPPVFVSHQHGKLSTRQHFAVNIGSYITTQRHCCCWGNCGCGRSLRQISPRGSSIPSQIPSHSDEFEMNSRGLAPDTRQHSAALRTVPPARDRVMVAWAGWTPIIIYYPDKDTDPSSSVPETVTDELTSSHELRMVRGAREKESL
eukprot:COSAG02_NODE_4393_length_5412_cov_10.835057_2_plen_256_part_00